MNKIASEPIVIMKRGGKSGGNSEITDYGMKLISSFQKLEKEFSEFAAKKTIWFSQIFQMQYYFCFVIHKKE